MKSKEYAKALYELLTSAKSQAEQEKILEDFKEFLNKKSKKKMISKIFGELLRIYEKEEKRAPKIIVASEDFKEKSQELAKTYGVENPQTKINPNIVGGFIIKGRNFILDNSYKHHLLELYKKIVNS